LGLRLRFGGGRLQGRDGGGPGPRRSYGLLLGFGQLGDASGVAAGVCGGEAPRSAAFGQLLVAAVQTDQGGFGGGLVFGRGPGPGSKTFDVAF
jgi:hypothetical protein